MSNDKLQDSDYMQRLTGKKRVEFQNPTIIGEPRPLEPTDIDRRLGGLPYVLAYAHQWIVYGTDPRTTDQQDIPMLMICQMARQSGFMETYSIGQLTICITEVGGALLRR